MKASSLSKTARKPRRVFVPFGKRPPKGVIWGDSAVDYHARRAHYSRFLGRDVDPEPARLDELRAELRGYLIGRDAGTNWGYYRGRNLACPYRCALDSTTCPVDVLVEEINKPSQWWSKTHRGSPPIQKPPQLAPHGDTE